MEQVATMSGVDIKKDTGDDDGLFFEQFLKKCLFRSDQAKIKIRSECLRTRPLLRGGGSFSTLTQM